MKTTLRALTISAALVAAAGTVGTFAFPDYAYANNGNGKGNGNGGRDNDRGNSRADRETGRPAHAGNNGRGALASELRGLNSMYANPNAMANASDNSMHGRLRTYQSEALEARTAVASQNEAAIVYQDLLLLTAEEIAVAYPNGGYDAALAAAKATYDATTATAETALADADAALATLTGGRTLSDAAMAELNAQLGL